MALLGSNAPRRLVGHRNHFLVKCWRVVFSYGWADHFGLPYGADYDRLGSYPFSPYSMSVENKYELTEEVPSTGLHRSGYVRDRTSKLKRIRALRDIPQHEVKAGDLGGFVESESNLSQDGDCWIGGHAQVYGHARVYGDAVVYGNAVVSGNAFVYGHAWILGNAEVSGNASVSGSAHVHGNAKVYGNAEVFGAAHVYGNARVFGNARVSGAVDICEFSAVYENATVYGDVWVCGNSRVYGDARVYDDAFVSGHTRVSGDVGLNIGRYEGSFCYGHLPVNEDEEPLLWASRLHGHLSFHVTELFGIACNEDDTVSIHIPSGVGNLLRILRIPESRAIETLEDRVTVRACDVIALFGKPDHRSCIRPSEGP